ncbi:unnamed protein product [Albugo candida]|nr:unnamed protein product [Albugo candida]|eukprot:CCI43111.1 unnamed protein product [Albugo candida]
MAKLISTRLESLAEIVDTRKQMLGNDFVSTRSNSNPRRTIGNLTQSSARKNALMERLFGSEDVISQQEQFLKNKMQCQKADARKNARLRLEKQLQAGMEGHILRSVDSYHDRSKDESTDSVPAIPLHTEAFLQYVYKRIHFGKGRKSFRQFVLSEVSCGLYENVFWLCFCQFFQQESTKEKQQLAQSISKRYVELLQNHVLQSNFDAVFQAYPFAIASSVCWTLHYLFPGSRHLYTFELKTEARIFMFVGRILLGLELCATSVQIARKQYFPEDVMEEVKTRAKWKRLQRQQSALGSSLLEQSLAKADAAEKAMNEVMVIPHLARAISCKNVRVGRNSDRNMLAKSFSTSILEKSSNIDEHNQKTSTSVCWQTMVQSDIVHNRQIRTTFDTSQQSHLLKEFLATPIQKRTKSCLLHRTIPTKNCIVGGEVTFRKRCRTFTIAQRLNSWNRYNPPNAHLPLASAISTKNCFQDLRKLKERAHKELDDLDRERDVVLKGGKKSIQLYCATLLRLKNEASESIKPMDSLSSKSQNLTSR